MFTLTRGQERLSKRIAILQERLDLATRSLEKISGGSFELELPPYAADLLDDNGKVFYQTLQSVKEKLTEYAIREYEQKWIAEGMNQFMKVMTGNDRTSDDFYDQVLKYIVQYTEGNQGGIFLLNDTDSEDPFLELTSAYAYGKKKFEHKRIELGEGMLGQCFLENETSYVTHVPKDYTKITSGLGEATPRSLIMLPMRYDGKVVGIIELAYFKSLENYKRKFLEKVTESITTVTLNLRNTKRAQELSAESVRKARMLQQQEEELRQNVEELMATQEEMRRQQSEIQAQTELMKIIIDNIPFPIFVKDEKGKYTIVNKAEARLFNLEDKDLIGKDDSQFVSNAEEWDVIRKSDQKVLQLNEPVELPLQNFTTVGGKSYIFKTTKVPFVNSITGKKNILGVSIDLTEKLSLEKKLLNEKRINQNNTFINIAGRQRMLSQKIGFYCETLVRGKVEHASFLRDAIELHEHSLQVLRYGGLPIGITTDSPLPPLDQELVPGMENVEVIWNLYKSAAENILYFYLTEDKTGFQSHQIDNWITTVEDNAEALLNAHNKFMMSYIEKSSKVVTT
jgi:PAS domain S-box-containing protein